MKQKITSTKSPAVVGPYSHGIQSGNFLFCSGQIGTDPQTNMLVSDDVVTQTTQVFENIKTLITAAGGTMDDIVKTAVYLKNIDDFPQMIEVYKTFFTEPFPARSTIGVAALPKGALVEIECITAIKKEVA